MTSITFFLIIVGLVVTITFIFMIKLLLSPQKIEKIQECNEQGKYSTAIKLCDQILSKEPGNNLVRYYLGLAYLNNNDKDNALEELKKVNIAGNFTSIDNEIKFRTILAKLYSDFKQPKEALKEYILLIKLQPEVEQWYYESGCLFEQLKKIKNAVNYFKKTLLYNPQNANAHFQLGKIFYKMDKYDDAEKELNLSIRYEIKGYKCYFYLGKIYKSKNDYKKAIVAFEKSQRDPELKIQSLLERGLCYVNIKNFDLAILEFTRVIANKTDIEQETFLARYFLALCFEEKRNLDKAMEQWEEIFSKNPSYKDVGEKLKIYKDIRNDDKMKDYLTASSYDFMELCKLLMPKLKMKVRDISQIQNGCQVVGVVANTENQGTKKDTVLVWFLRFQKLVPEKVTRSFHEEMKNLNIRKGTIVTNTGFSEESIEFSERRPINLILKNQLQTMLQEI